MTKEILEALVFASIIVSIACQKYIKGTPVMDFAFHNDVVTDFNCSAGSNLKECSICCGRKFGQTCSDCKTTMLCFGEPILEQSCARLDRSKPYCKDGACVAEAPSGCPLQTTTNFKCTDRGEFPDPDDCRRYYICNAAGFNQATAYDCPSRYVYDSKIGFCKEKRTDADCKTISCKNRWNEYHIFDADKSILVFCSQIDESYGTILFRCPDPFNMEYDENSLSCEFICKTEGRFTLQGQPTKFVECYHGGDGLESRIQDCPSGFIFDEYHKICV